MPESSIPPPTVQSILVVDSWPVLEWLKGRACAVRFRQLLFKSQAAELVLLISSINLGEIYYNCLIEWGEPRAEALISEFRNLPILVIHPTEEDTLAAARIKGRHRCSYADAFACALALEFSCSVVTGDKDFLRMQQAGVITVEWWGV